MSKRLCQRTGLAAAGFSVLCVCVVSAQAQNGRSIVNDPGSARCRGCLPDDGPSPRRAAPRQQKTPHDLSDIFAPAKAHSFLRRDLRPAGPRRHDRIRLVQRSDGRHEAGDDVPGGLHVPRGRKAKGDGNAAEAVGEPLQPGARFDPEAKMSRGKPLVVGPTARLPQRMDWDAIAAMSPADIRHRNIFPYKLCLIPCKGAS